MHPRAAIGHCRMVESRGGLGGWFFIRFEVDSTLGFSKVSGWTPRWVFEEIGGLADWFSHLESQAQSV